MTRIGQLTVEALGETEIRAVRAFAAPAQLVWEAHTRPELLQRWMLGPPGWEMPVCEIDLRVGGRWRYVWRKIDGREMAQHGTYKELMPYTRIVHTEKFDGDPTPGEGAVITTTFADARGRTTMTMIMAFPSPEIRDQALKVGMETGMEVGYERLDALFEAQAAA